MIKKLRIKFIIISMLSLLIVLATIITGINISNYQSVSSNADTILKTLYDNGGRFDNKRDEFNPNQDRTIDDFNEKNPEIQFETRYFTVKITEVDGDKKYEVFMDFIRAVETKEEAINYAKKALKHSKNGYISNYRYIYGEENGITTVIFVDCSRGLDNANSFLKASVIISLIGYALVFIAIFIASKYVFRPVDDAYQKQKRFISNASHELKTPLTIISANNEIIEMTKGEDESTDAIKRQVNRLNQMVTSLSLLTKLSETKKIEKTNLNLSNLINELISDFNLSFDNKKIDINISNDLIIEGDEGLIKQLLSIIIDNSIKYSNTYITLHAYNDSKNIIFECINDCYEIEDGNHPEVFERFYRNDNIRSQKEGSGIGLSIAKEITDLHKANIIASSVNNSFKIKIIF